MPTISIAWRLRRPSLPLLLSGLLVGVRGLVHGREWIDTHHDVPTSLCGAQVVRVGFVVDAAVSAVPVGALVAAVFAARRLAAVVVVLTALVEAAPTLTQTPRGSVLGWMESGWSRGRITVRGSRGRRLARAGRGRPHRADVAST